MKHYAKFELPVLLLALAILFASYGGTSGQNAGKEDHPTIKKTSQPVEGMGDMEGMDHGGMASGMLMKNGKYSDERFIDAMVPHHEGAVQMARVALKNAEHSEIKQLAENVIATQRAEIQELEPIKKQEFGTSRVPMDMSMGQMKKMGMMMNPDDLAKRDPFGRALIDNMITHHQAAVEMAEVAREKSHNPKIRELANNIVEAQKREISQMKQWRELWYQKG